MDQDKENQQGGPRNEQRDDQRGTEHQKQRHDKTDPQDPARQDMQPPIPAHPPDAVAAGDADKIVAPAKPDSDPSAPPHVNTGIASGPSMDQVGGAGLGKAPGEAGDEHPATTRARDTRAEDLQDRTRDD
jgi:hypothetical protein